MNQRVKTILLLAWSPAVVSLAAMGCDSLADGAAADGNAYLQKSDRLYPVSANRHDWGLPDVVLAAKAVDLDGDGDDDLIVSGFGVMHVGINRTSEEYGRLEFDWFSLAYPHSPLAADLDGDGAHELLTLHDDEETINVIRAADLYADYQIACRGTDAAHAILPSKTQVARPACPNATHYLDQSFFVDVNGDGRSDLVCGPGEPPDSDATQTDARGTVYLADAEGLGFGPAVTSPMPSSPRDLYFGDFDGDGHTDLLGGDFAQGALVVGYGDGQGHFASPVLVRKLSGVHYTEFNPEVWRVLEEVLIADFNGDGIADVFGREHDGQQTGGFGSAIFYGRGRGQHFDREEVVAHMESWFESRAADLDEDGESELVHLGFDQTFLSSLGTVIRVVAVDDGGPQVVSNTLNREATGAYRTFRALVGRFLGNGQTQLLIFNTHTYDTFLYQWNQCGSTEDHAKATGEVPCT